MATFIITFCFIAFVIAAMAVGVILGKKPIKGSCGGMSALGMETACDVCGGDKQVCDEENDRVATTAKTSASDLAYDATKK
ncbi:(Na+)-NQR maturation NqrM [Dasania sp. GY-MA-18]|uniref:(Na+)-NQR maturation NqrM n=1 Tax=Dasania phycosphaerae TaxID=2950436 RepID=A0A9J6RIN7_9GAMM|nr:MULTISPECIES: (Na+)-NQR maturation NqrM [Dasania]MCR8921903.1 (Na+)-NQR maturation NqrM [Dasania sp. GY-MA-18]MCZ0864331.1 (Na+)-NQR maturation NqrM [Dasania phycosphaerae]MCZ0868059.1 (Na+)-NQR maturation NqrM [Dasania phycosphaerae]